MYRGCPDNDWPGNSWLTINPEPVMAEIGMDRDAKPEFMLLSKSGITSKLFFNKGDCWKLDIDE
jgi:hypothetical protein